MTGFSGADCSSLVQFYFAVCVCKSLSLTYSLFIGDCERRKPSTLAIHTMSYSIVLMGMLYYAGLFSDAFYRVGAALIGRLSKYGVISATCNGLLLTFTQR